MKSAKISDVHGRRVWDSRGRPTVEVEVHCGTSTGRAIAPAGASTGSAEAVELRDGGTAFGGRDVRRAVANVDGTIAAALIGADVTDQRDVDARLVALDNSPTLASIGANAVVATSMACAHAAAAVNQMPLWQYLLGSSSGSGGGSSGGPTTMPLPEIQIFGGGAHAGRRIDIQDLMVMSPGASSFAEALDWTAEIYAAAGTLVDRSGVADEGGWWPAFDTNEQAIETVVRAIELAGFKPGVDVVVSLDVAASELWHEGHYRLGLEGRDLTSEEMCAMVVRWTTNYPIASVEDPLGEDDLDGLRAFTAAVGDRVQVVGDDVYVTNAARVAELTGVANALLVKPNQAGTLSRAAAALAASRAANCGAIVSARSGESEDVTIVHLAVGWQVAQLKVGSITRGERTAKWNEALRIEDLLGADARFAGWAPLPSTTGGHR
ncbi:MAG: phosphopyruvate hydratase [Ilumatobacteraceae bacterium]